MDVVFAVSGHRSISELEALNTYTARQAEALCEHLIKERFMVVSAVMRSFGGGAPSSQRQGSKEKKTPEAPRRNRVPSFYKPRAGARVKVIDLDGPMEALQPYLGKGAINRAVFTERANAR